MKTTPRHTATGPNPLHPDRMTAHERRAELCSILARGILRQKSVNSRQLSAQDREFPLHNSADRSGSATPIQWRTA